MSDTIYRQDAPDALKKCSKHCVIPDGYHIDAEDAEYRIRRLPSAQPERRWIPCSERLPENGRQVLVYARSVHYALAKYDEMIEADGTYKKQWVTFDAWKPFYTVMEVLAWCELPEPPSGRRW